MTSITIDTTDISIDSSVTVVELEVIESPITIETAYSTVIQQGSGSGDSNETIISFGYGDAAPKPLGYFIGTILSCRLCITEAFNANAMLQIGTQGDVGLLMSSQKNNARESAEYETTPLIKLTSATEMFLTITLDQAVTQGKGFVIIEVA